MYILSGIDVDVTTVAHNKKDPGTAACRAVLLLVGKASEVINPRAEQILELARMFHGMGLHVAIASFSLDPDSKPNWQTACETRGLGDIRVFAPYEIDGHADVHPSVEQMRTFGSRTISVTSFREREGDAPYLSIRHAPGGGIGNAILHAECDRGFSSESSFVTAWLSEVLETVAREAECGIQLISVICINQSCTTELFAMTPEEQRPVVIGYLQGTIFKNPYRWGAALNNANSYLSMLDCYDALAFFTDHERQDAKHLYGDRSNLHFAPPVQKIEEVPGLKSARHEKRLLVMRVEKNSLEGAAHVLNAFIEACKEDKLWQQQKKKWQHQKQEQQPLALTIIASERIEKQLRKLDAARKAKRRIEFVEEADRVLFDPDTCLAFISAYSYSGFDCEIAKSLSKGIPVIALDHLYGPGEYLQDGKTGFVVPPEDEDAIRDAIVSLTRRSTLSRFAWQRRALKAAAAFDWPRTFHLWSGILQAAETHRDNRSSSSFPNGLSFYCNPLAALAVKRESPGAAAAGGNGAPVLVVRLSRRSASPGVEAIAPSPTFDRISLTIGYRRGEDIPARICPRGTVVGRDADADYICFDLNGLFPEIDTHTDERPRRLIIWVESNAYVARLVINENRVLPALPDAWCPTLPDFAAPLDAKKDDLS